MGFSGFLKKNAGAFAELSGRFGGTLGTLASSGFGALDARQQEKAAVKYAQQAQAALADEERRRAGALQGLGVAPRSSSVSLFSEEGELGQLLPKGIPPLAALGIGAVVLLIVARR